jgi:predicted unusual protein kinase regulating ubiquinone biosynthesis (AarF/ABC1/UbiB family)
MKSSVFGRSLQLITHGLKAGSKELGRSVHKGLAGDYDGSSLVKTRVDQARVLAENLSQLKGAAMKAGQLLSIDSSDFLPPEVIEILSKLQDSGGAYCFRKAP